MVTKKKPGRPKLKAKERHTERETVSFTKSEKRELKKRYEAWVYSVTTLPSGLMPFGNPPPSFAVFLRLILTCEISPRLRIL